MARYSSGRKVGPYCGTMRRVNKQQMGPLYHSKRFQDTIQVNPSSFSSSGKSESVFLPVTTRRDRRTSPETGSGKGTRSGNSRFLFLAISHPKKEWKVTSGNRSVYTKSIHKETTFQDGDSQVSKTINIGQWLGCLHRPDGCVSSCPNSSTIQEISSINGLRVALYPLGYGARTDPFIYLESSNIFISDAC